MKRKLSTLPASLFLACIMLMQPFASVFAVAGSTAVAEAQQAQSASATDNTAQEGGTKPATLGAAPDSAIQPPASATDGAQSGAASTKDQSDANAQPDADATPPQVVSDDSTKTNDEKSVVEDEKTEASSTQTDASQPALFANEPSITTDLIIDITQLSQETPSITGTYDTGGNPGDYVPGKDFSKTDNVATGKVVDYSIGVSLSSQSSATYPIDKMYLEVEDAASPGQLKVYYLNADPNPQIITDDGSNPLVAGYSMAMTGLVFDQSAGITSNSTQRMPITITVPPNILWKSKVMPKIRIVCERAGQVEKSEPFTLTTTRFSSAATLDTKLETPDYKWAAVGYTTTAQGTGFLLPFDIQNMQMIPSTITPLGTAAQYDTITFSAKIGAKLDGVTQPLTADSFDFTILPVASYTLQSKTYAGGVLTVVVKPVNINPIQSFPPLSVIGRVFVPYTKGVAQTVTVGLDGSWNTNFSTDGVELSNFINQFLFAHLVSGSITRSKVISFVVNPIPVAVTENILASFAPPDSMTHTLRITPNTFTNSKDIQFVRIVDSDVASLPKAQAMRIALYSGPTYTYVTAQNIPSSMYTFQYAYLSTAGAFNPNAVSQQVINGAVAMDTYENVVASTGKKPNVMLAKLAGDATQGLPITAETTLQYEIIGPTVIPLPGSEIYTIYSANPSADYTSYVHSYIALATNYLTTAAAYAAYGSAIASVDQFIKRGNTVYLDLGTNQPPNPITVVRFNSNSRVRADINLPMYEAIMVSGLYATTTGAITDISDYSKEYFYKMYRRIISPSGNGNAQFKAGTVVTMPIDPAVAPYLYLSRAPYLRVLNPGTITWTEIPITTYSYNASSIKLTIPEDFVLTADNSIFVPVRFIVPYANIQSTTLTPQMDRALYLATFNQGAVLETFPNTTPYFITTYQNTPYRLLGGNVDTTGLMATPQEYLGGTVRCQ